MNIEAFAKIITVIGSVFALYKVIVDFPVSKKSHFREEFKFIKEFIAELKPDTHPYVIEKGYFAITGDATLTAFEITHLLMLSSPALALKQYSVARKYIEFKEVASTGKVQISFRDNYTEDKRKWIKRLNSTLYYIFALLAFAPILFVKNIFGDNWQVSIVVTSMALLSFGSLAYIYLDEYSRVLRGEELVAMQ